MLLNLLQDSSWGVLWVTLLSLLAFVLYTQRAKYAPGVPKDPNNHPFFGQMLHVIRNLHRAHDFNCDLFKKLGHTYTWGLPFGDVGINTISPKNVEYILKGNFENFEKGSAFQSIMTDLLGHGIFVVDGPEWREKRKIASHMFSEKVLRDDMAATFRKHSAAMLEVIDEWAAPADTLADSNSQDVKVFNIQDLFFRFTLDSICEIAFGQCPDTLHNPTQTFPRAFDRAQYLINQRIWQPRFLWRIKHALQLGEERELTEVIKEVHGYCDRVVEARLQESQSTVRRYPDLVSRFITHAHEQGIELTREYLRDVVLNFMLAGRDTTACLLSWAVYELTRNPAEEQRILEEIELFKAKAGASLQKDWSPNYEQCNQMVYVDAFLREVLRLHPSVPQDAKFAVEECILPDGGYRVPRNAMVCYVIYAMGRNKQVFGDDVLEFKPSRWIDSARKVPTPFEFPVFNAGLRTCLGQHVAILEAKVMLCSLLGRFRVRSHLQEAPDNPLYQLTIVLPIKGGMPVSVQRRR